MLSIRKAKAILEKIPISRSSKLLVTFRKTFTGNRCQSRTYSPTTTLCTDSEDTEYKCMQHSLFVEKKKNYNFPSMSHMNNTLLWPYSHRNKINWSF